MGTLLVYIWSQRSPPWEFLLKGAHPKSDKGTSGAAAGKRRRERRRRERRRRKWRRQRRRQQQRWQWPGIPRELARDDEEPKEKLEAAGRKSSAKILS